MKLYYTPTSPFVRKVLVTAHETGQAAGIELVTLRPSPLHASPELSCLNPLSKIPALVLDDGSVLYDSAVICEYLDSLHPGRPLVPPSGSARWRILRLQALSDGALDAAVLSFYDGLHRPKELAWEPWPAGQREKANQGLDALDREAAAFDPTTPDMAQIAVGAAIGWFDFRNVLGDIRATRPTLSAWYEKFRARPSMRATEPHV